ncbi:hypothetical protein [Pacificispira sp.]|uniref:hypothetical protein n=1 Tax=Pacificispira sp. TaxID=2888761 RepID=UPI003BA96F2D
MRIRANEAFSYPENDRGDMRHVPQNWRGDVPETLAEELIAAGLAEKEAAPAAGTVILSARPAAPAPEDLPADVQVALPAVFRALTVEEWGKDGVPNLAPIQAGLKSVLGKSVKLNAAQRNAALAVFHRENPDFEPGVSGAAAGGDDPAQGGSDNPDPPIVGGNE